MDINRKLSISFGLILLLAIAGFYRTYFQFFPDFEEKTTVLVHLHAISMLLWLTLLIVQPLFIRWKSLTLHRALGKLSLLVFALVVFTTLALMVTHFIADQEAGVSLTQNLAIRIISVITITSFITFYSLAIYHRKTFQLHYSYMLGTGLSVIPAAMTRLFYSLGLNSFVAEVLTLLIMNGIIGYLWYRNRHFKFRWNPFMVIFIFQMLLTAYYFLMIGLLFIN